MKLLFFSFFFLVFSGWAVAQQTDSGIVRKDSSVHIGPKWVVWLADNYLLNSKGRPVELTEQPRKEKSKEAVFYLLAALLLFLAFSRYFYPRYFTNLFRVFFNTSLRQTQLSDQLLQAKFPSLLFNLFFVFSGGLFVYFLLLHFSLVRAQISWVTIGLCLVLPGLVYVAKFCLLKFTGWVTGYSEETDTYIFIFFLINKILGIFLVPFTILLAFADHSIADSAVMGALVVAAFFLLLRFIRSYSLLQNRLKISRFHFLLYVLGIEILPLLLIYKGLVILLDKNL